MTGFGSAEHVEDGVSYALELRSLNHRYFKLTVKVPEHLQFAEPQIEKQIRARLARGSVAYSLRIRSEGSKGTATINVPAMQGYVDAMAKVTMPDGLSATVDLGAIASLPGVYQQPEPDDSQRQREATIVASVTTQALESLIDLRRREGEILQAEILRFCEEVRTRVAKIAVVAPRVVESYHERLKARVGSLMDQGGFELAADGLMREVAIFAERCDITEELTRLTTHLDRFGELCASEEPVGRTLDFLSQELLREANTIASKSNDAEIAGHVVEIKGLIDRMKEQVQNVE